MNDIPSDDRVYKKLIQSVQLRMMRSALWSDTQRQTWVRMYKIYRRIVDGVASGDDYSIFLGYAFAIVEQINSKVTEPMLQMGVPFAVFSNEFGDGAKADNFAQVCRDFYGKPNVQDSLRKSKKEMIITGNRWEVDQWLHVERPGKRWGKVPQVVEKAITRPDGTPLVDKAGKPVTAKMTVQVDAEVDRKIVRHYGFNTRYPSVFNMYPEPDRPTIDTGQPTDMSWIVEELGELALGDLCREQYVDPADKMTKPVYDFSRLLHDAGKAAQERYERIMEGRDPAPDKYGPLIRPVRDWSTQSDWGRQNKNTLYPSENNVDRASSEDRDKIWVVQMREAGEILTLAQGRYIIHRKRDPWHVPGLRVRIENYTTDPEFIYGEGALGPIEDEISELNDIHSLSMANFYRLVNKMVAIAQDAIVSMDDFRARAGGKIRIASEFNDVRMAIMDIPQQNVVQEMLGAESNVRGLVEFESSNMDGSPGVQGTKQQHKTKGGMEIIQQNTATRFITMQAQALINEARRGLSMQELFEQFAFEKMPYRLVREDGSTAYAKFNKDDVDTEGRGFNFLIEVDPLWGNTQAQRQLSIDVFSEGVDYEKLRAELKDPTMRKVNLDKLFEQILKKSGFRDTSKLFSMPDQSVSPEDELQKLMQGGIVECKGDLQHHIETHLLQMQSPMLKQAVEAGKANPNTIKNLGLLIQMDLARLKTFVTDPQGAAQKRLDKAGMGMPGAPSA